MKEFIEQQLAENYFKRRRQKGRYEKYIITNGIIEIYKYQSLNTRGNGGKNEGEGKNSDENYKTTQRKRRNEVRRAITANFDNKSKFVTLTFNNEAKHDITDVKACNKEFSLFIKRLKYKYPDLKYLAVIEFQDKNGRGAVHYHMICNLPFIENKTLSDIWDNGFIKITSIHHVDNVGAYIIKYMTADLDDKRLQGLKGYNASRGLQKPVIYTSWKKADYKGIEETREAINGKSPTYCSEYEGEFTGKVEYTQFNFNRKSIK